ncbi:universal stress protein [Sphingobium sp. Cam5-1]|uniref:universal stress protein n=1 Tax=Sphingobium sp. Cam5-1 TaxID=2789327 RepID=UPI001E492D54|nr:universal stress protein [Sphingobium sp. Cam5-1]
MMVWTNILAPVLGGTSDAQALSVAKALAVPFSATISVVFASPSPTSLFNWVALEGGLSVTDMAVTAIEAETDRLRARCRRLLAELDYPNILYEEVTTDDWLGLRSAARLADVVIWERSAAEGNGLFAGAFQQLLLDERRPAFLADRPPVMGGTVAIAWDGGRESSRALRRSIPLLRHADRVVLLTVLDNTGRPSDGARGVRYLLDQGIRIDTQIVHTEGDPGPAIIDASRDMDASLLVAGAFGHPRLHRFIFGGTTQYLLESKHRPALFLSH